MLDKDKHRDKILCLVAGLFLSLPGIAAGTDSSSRPVSVLSAPSTADVPHSRSNFSDPSDSMIGVFSEPVARYDSASGSFGAPGAASAGVADSDLFSGTSLPLLGGGDAEADGVSGILQEAGNNLRQRAESLLTPSGTAEALQRLQSGGVGGSMISDTVEEAGYSMVQSAINAQLSDVEQRLQESRWLRSINLSWSPAFADREDVIQADAVFSLYDGEYSALMAQLGLQSRDGEGGGNIGAALRTNAFDSWLFGLNLFYDYLSDPQVERWSAGLEMTGAWLGFSSNAYFGAGEDRSGDVISYSPDGWDAELTGQIPHLPWARIAARYYSWDLEPSGRLHGSDYRLTLQPVPLLGLALRYDSPDIGDSELGFEATLQYEFGQSLHEQLSFSNVQPVSNAWERRFDRVRREYEQRVQTRTAGASTRSLLSVSQTGTGSCTGSSCSVTLSISNLPSGTTNICVANPPAACIAPIAPGVDPGGVLARNIGTNCRLNGIAPATGFPEPACDYTAGGDQIMLRHIPPGSYSLDIEFRGSAASLLASVSSVAVLLTAPADTRGVISSEELVSVAEGGSASYTVRLSSAPEAGAVPPLVTLTATSMDTSLVTVSPASLSFSTADWQTEQTITLTGVEDTDTDSETLIINYSATGGGYDGATLLSQQVMVRDNDALGISSSEAASVIELSEGGTETYTLVLNTQPSADVTIALSSGDSSAVTVAPASLTFTTVNWNMPQTVTLTGVEEVDATDTESEDVSISYAVSSGDENYNNFALASQSVRVSDNDVVRVSLATDPAGTSTVAEGGSVSVVLTPDRAPPNQLTVRLRLSGTGITAADYSLSVAGTAVSVDASGIALIAVATDNPVVLTLMAAVNDGMAERLSLTVLAPADPADNTYVPGTASSLDIDITAVTPVVSLAAPVPGTIAESSTATGGDTAGSDSVLVFSAADLATAGPGIEVSFTISGTGIDAADYSLLFNGAPLVGTSLTIPSSGSARLTVRALGNADADDTANEDLILTLTDGTAYNLSTEVAERARSITITPRDSTAPGALTGLTATAGISQVSLSWTNPADTDLALTRISWTGPSSGSMDVPAPLTSVVIMLDMTGDYTFTAMVVDSSGNAGPVAPAVMASVSLPEIYLFSRISSGLTLTDDGPPAILNRDIMHLGFTNVPQPASEMMLPAALNIGFTYGGTATRSTMAGAFSSGSDYRLSIAATNEYNAADGSITARSISNSSVNGRTTITDIALYLNEDGESSTEPLTIALAPPAAGAGYTVAGGSETISINIQPTPVISFASDAITILPGADRTAEVVIEASNLASGVTSQIQVTVAGTAMAGTDYTTNGITAAANTLFSASHSGNTVTLTLSGTATGTATGTLNIPVLAAITNGDTITLTIDEAIGYNVEGASISSTVTAMSPTVQFDSETSTATYGDSAVSVPLTISAIPGAPTVPVTISLTGTATHPSGTDAISGNQHYRLVANTGYTITNAADSSTLMLTSSATGSTNHNIMVEIRGDDGDNIVNAPVEAVLTITAGGSVDLGSQTTHTITISDNDLPELRLINIANPATTTFTFTDDTPDVAFSFAMYSPNTAGMMDILLAEALTVPVSYGGTATRSTMAGAFSSGSDYTLSTGSNRAGPVAAGMSNTYDATAPGNITVLGTNIAFSGGSLILELNGSVNEDSDSSTETATIALASPTANAGYTVASESSTFTVNIQPTPVISFASNAITVLPGTVSNPEVVIEASNLVSGVTSTILVTVTGTAMAGTAYTMDGITAVDDTLFSASHSGNTVTLTLSGTATGTATGTLNIPVLAAIGEGETITLTINEAVGYNVEGGGASISSTVTAMSPTVEFESDASNVNFGGGPVLVRLTISATPGMTTVPVTINLTGSATHPVGTAAISGGQHYRLVANTGYTITNAADSSTLTLTTSTTAPTTYDIMVEIRGADADTMYSLPSNAIFTLAAGGGVVVGSESTHTITISDDDLPELQLTSGGASDTFTFTDDDGGGLNFPFSFSISSPNTPADTLFPMALTVPVSYGGSATRSTMPDALSDGSDYGFSTTGATNRAGPVSASMVNTYDAATGITVRGTSNISLAAAAILDILGLVNEDGDTMTETATISLASPVSDAGYTLASDSETITLNIQPTPEISFASDAITVLPGSDSMAEVVIEASNLVSGVTSEIRVTVGGTTTAGTDYTTNGITAADDTLFSAAHSGNRVTMTLLGTATGTATGTLNIPVLAAISEGETITLTIDEAVGYNVANDSISSTLTAMPPTVEFGGDATSSAAYGDSAVMVPLTISAVSGAPTVPVVINTSGTATSFSANPFGEWHYNLVENTGTPGYTVVSTNTGSTLMLTTSATGPTTHNVLVEIREADADNTYTLPRDAIFTLATGGSVVVGGQNTHTITISDDDLPEIAFRRLQGETAGFFDDHNEAGGNPIEIGNVIVTNVAGVIAFPEALNIAISYGGSAVRSTIAAGDTQPRAFSPGSDYSTEPAANRLGGNTYNLADGSLFASATFEVVVNRFVIATIPFNINPDGDPAFEDVTFALASPASDAGYTVADDSHQITANIRPTPVISFASDTITVLPGAASTAQVAIEASNVVPSAAIAVARISVTLSGSATAGMDYTTDGITAANTVFSAMHSGNTVTLELLGSIASGMDTGTLNIPVLAGIGDGETIVLTINEARSYNVAGNSISATITATPPTVEFVSDASSAAYGDGVVEVELTIPAVSGAPTVPVTINLTGTATHPSGTDPISGDQHYRLVANTGTPSYTITNAADSSILMLTTSATKPTTHDIMVEIRGADADNAYTLPTEAIFTLAAGGSVTLGGRTTHTITISDDDLLEIELQSGYAARGVTTTGVFNATDDYPSQDIMFQLFVSNFPTADVSGTTLPQPITVFLSEEGTADRSTTIDSFTGNSDYRINHSSYDADANTVTVGRVFPGFSDVSVAALIREDGDPTVESATISLMNPPPPNAGYTVAGNSGTSTLNIQPTPEISFAADTGTVLPGGMAQITINAERLNGVLGVNVIDGSPTTISVALGGTADPDTDYNADGITVTSATGGDAFFTAAHAGGTITLTLREGVTGDATGILNIPTLAAISEGETIILTIDEAVRYNVADDSISNTITAGALTIGLSHAPGAFMAAAEFVEDIDDDDETRSFAIRLPAGTATLPSDFAVTVCMTGAAVYGTDYNFTGSSFTNGAGTGTCSGTMGTIGGTVVTEDGNSFLRQAYTIANDADNVMERATITILPTAAYNISIGETAITLDIIHVPTISFSAPLEARVGETFTVTLNATNLNGRATPLSFLGNNSRFGDPNEPTLSAGGGYVASVVADATDTNRRRFIVTTSDATGDMTSGTFSIRVTANTPVVRQFELEDVPGYNRAGEDGFVVAILSSATPTGADAYTHPLTQISVAQAVNRFIRDIDAFGTVISGPIVTANIPANTAVIEVPAGLTGEFAIGVHTAAGNVEEVNNAMPLYTRPFLQIPPVAHRRVPVMATGSSYDVTAMAGAGGLRGSSVGDVYAVGTTGRITYTINGLEHVYEVRVTSAEPPMIPTIGLSHATGARMAAAQFVEDIDEDGNTRSFAIRFPAGTANVPDGFVVTVCMTGTAEYGTDYNFGSSFTRGAGIGTCSGVMGTIGGTVVTEGGNSFLRQAYTIVNDADDAMESATITILSNTDAYTISSGEDAITLDIIHIPTVSISLPQPPEVRIGETLAVTVNATNPNGLATTLNFSSTNTMFGETNQPVPSAGGGYVEVVTGTTVNDIGILTVTTSDATGAMASGTINLAISANDPQAGSTRRLVIEEGVGYNPPSTTDERTEDYGIVPAAPTGANSYTHPLTRVSVSRARSEFMGSGFVTFGFGDIVNVEIPANTAVIEIPSGFETESFAIGLHASADDAAVLDPPDNQIAESFVNDIPDRPLYFSPGAPGLLDRQRLIPVISTTSTYAVGDLDANDRLYGVNSTGSIVYTINGVRHVYELRVTSAAPPPPPPPTIAFGGDQSLQAVADGLSAVTIPVTATNPNGLATSIMLSINATTGFSVAGSSTGNDGYIADARIVGDNLLLTSSTATGAMATGAISFTFPEDSNLIGSEVAITVLLPGPGYTLAEGNGGTVYTIGVLRLSLPAANTYTHPLTRISVASVAFNEDSGVPFATGDITTANIAAGVNMVEIAGISGGRFAIGLHTAAGDVAMVEAANPSYIAPGHTASGLNMESQRIIPDAAVISDADAHNLGTLYSGPLPALFVADGVVGYITYTIGTVEHVYELRVTGPAP